MGDRNELRTQLFALEQELKRLALWRQKPPTAEALASNQPFCVDTLSLSEWLQWLMIPRLHALLDADQPLPATCNVLAIAEESFKELGQDARELLRLIAELDRLITHLP